MSYAAVMVYVDIDAIPEQRVRIASEIATKLNAALIGFSARAVPPLFVAEGVIIEEATEADIKQMHAIIHIFTFHDLRVVHLSLPLLPRHSMLALSD